jgi:hypothetical protein
MNPEDKDATASKLCMKEDIKEGASAKSLLDDGGSGFPPPDRSPSEASETGWESDAEDEGPEPTEPADGDGDLSPLNGLSSVVERYPDLGFRGAKYRDFEMKQARYHRKRKLTTHLSPILLASTEVSYSIQSKTELMYYQEADGPKKNR